MTPCTTYLVLPCPAPVGPVETSQQRIVARRASCPLALVDYRHAPDLWAEAGLVNGYDHPSRLGSDRWVAMIGAYHHMLSQGAARPMVLVMVGTAVTVEAIDANGKFLGGLILPGHGIMLRALESGTAGLRVPTGEVCEFPTNTSDALTSGGTYAIAGAVERMVQHVRQHCGAEPACYMTGGAGWKMAPSMSVQFELVDSLIFDGLLEIAKHRLDHPTPVWPSRGLY